jgi:hypothetical protein
MVKRIVMSVFVVLAGLFLIADKFSIYFNFNLKNNFGFTNTSNLLWFTGVLVSNLLLIFILITNIKPYKISFIVPIYICFLDIYWVFFTDLYSDTSLFNIYVLGYSFLFLVCVLVVRSLFVGDVAQEKLRQSKITMLESILDMTYLNITLNKE